MSGFVESAGARLFTRVDGPDDAPWLVLSNSLAADHTMWDDQIDDLTRRYRVLRYDTRGHGASDAPEGPYDFSMLVADVVAVMDHHGIDKVTYMGLSLGGMTGLGLALAHPERVTRLVCCDARADAPEPFARSWDERLAAIEAGGMAAIGPGTLERWLNPTFRAAHPEVVARIEAMIFGTSPVGYAGCAAALKRLDYAKDLHRISVPTLFVVGSEDLGAPPAVMQAMANAVPGASLVVVQGSAHLPNIDNAPGFRAAVAPFLGLA
jgi:3-oxoadipate enol-lactonase